MNKENSRKRHRKYLSLAEAKREVRNMLDEICDFAGGGDIYDIWDSLKTDPSLVKVTNLLYNDAEKKLSKMHPEKREDILNALTSNGDTFYSRMDLIERIFDTGDLYVATNQRRKVA